MDHNDQSFSEDQKSELRAALSNVMLTPRLMDCYDGFLAKFLGTPYKPVFRFTAEWLEDPEFEDTYRRLSSPPVSFKLRLNAMEKRIEGVLGGLKAFDKRDYKKTKAIFD